MSFIKFDIKENKHFLEDDSNESPCIVAITDLSLSKFFFHDVKSFDYPYVFCIQSLKDITVSEEGEYLTKAFVYCSSQNETSGKNKSAEMENVLEVFFRKPKLITFFVNLLQDPKLDHSIMGFKCPKSGSARQKELLKNEIIQNLLIPDNENTQIFFYQANKNNENLYSVDEQSNKQIKVEVNSYSEILKKIKGIDIRDKVYEAVGFNNYENCLFDFVYGKFNRIHEIKSIKIFLAPDLIYDFNDENNTINCLNILRDDFLSAPTDCKKSIKNLIDHDEINNNQNKIIILKYGKNEPKEKINSPIVICFCSKSFGYNIQLSDLFYHVDQIDNDNNEKEKNSSVFSAANNLKEIRKQILDKAALIFETSQELFNNHLFSQHKNFYTQNFSFVFELAVDPLEENSYQPILMEIKSFEESLKTIDNIFFTKNYNNNTSNQINYENNNNKILNTWYNFLFEKSYDYLFKNKIIAVVGYTFTDLCFYEYCKTNKIKLYFLESKIPNDPFLDDYITKENLVLTSLYDFSKYEEESIKAAKTLKKLGINGVITFSDDLIPFKILLQEKLNMKFNYSITYKEIMIIKDKIETTNKLRSIQDANPNEANDYISDAEVIDDDNLDKITINGKKVFKLSKACGSFGIEIIEPFYKQQDKTSSTNDINNNINNENNILVIDQERTREKIKKIYNEKRLFVEKTPKDNGYGLFFDFKYFLSSYIEGSEHTITLVIREGKCIWYLISDVIADKTDEDEFYFEKASYFPSHILRDDAENEKIKNIILQRMLELNLFHCCVCVDFKKNENGIKILH